MVKHKSHDVNIAVCQYEDSLSSLLDKHTPLKKLFKVNMSHLRVRLVSVFTFIMYSEGCMAVKGH